MNNIRVRNVQELVYYLNHNNLDKDAEFVLDNRSILYVDDEGNKLTIITFTSEKEGIIKQDFYMMDNEIQQYIYQFMGYVDRDDWFKEFGIHEFENLCININNIFGDQFFFTLYTKDKVALNAPAISSDASFIFHKDGSIGFYGITKVEVLDILHDFIKNNDIKKIFRENVDFMEAQ